METSHLFTTPAACQPEEGHKENCRKGPWFKDQCIRHRGSWRTSYVVTPHSSAGQLISHTNQSMARRAEEEKIPAACFLVFPQILNFHAEIICKQGHLWDSVNPPPFVSSILGGHSRYTGYRAQKHGSLCMSRFRRTSGSQSPPVELTHSIVG